MESDATDARSSSDTRHAPHPCPGRSWWGWKGPERLGGKYVAGLRWLVAVPFNAQEGALVRELEWEFDTLLEPVKPRKPECDLP